MTTPQQHLGKIWAKLHGHPHLTHDQWLQYGHQNNWISPPLCLTHDGTGLTPQQEQEIDEGGDPCIHILQLYENTTHKQQAENNNPPNKWRTPQQWTHNEQ